MIVTGISGVFESVCFHTFSLPPPPIMRITVTILFLLGITILHARGEPIGKTEEESDEALLDCASQENTLGCLGTRLARSMDRIEMQVTGKKSETPMSVVIEQAGNFVAELVDDIQNPGRADQVDETSQLGEHGENDGFFFFVEVTKRCFSINFCRDEKEKKKIDTKVVG